MAYDPYGEPQIRTVLKEEVLPHCENIQMSQYGVYEIQMQNSEENSDCDEDCELCRLEQDRPDICATLCWAIALPVAILSIFWGMVYTL